MKYLACETRYWDYQRTAEQVDRDGWRKPAHAPRVYRVALAKKLVALSVRLAPSVREQGRESGAVQTATA